MKKVLLSIFLFMSVLNVVNALESSSDIENEPEEVTYKTGFVKCIEDNSPLNVKDAVGSYNVFKGLSCNASVTIIDETAGSANGCDWYKINYDNNKEGYVCSKYIAFDYIENEVNLVTNDKYGYVSCVENNDPLTIRPLIDSYDTVMTLSCDTKMEILDDNVGGNYRCANWYKIKANGLEGYACGTYVYKKQEISMSEEAQNDYKNYLKDIGFPDSYLDSLLTLHANHPNWQFRAFKTRLNWDNVIANENIGDRNLIYYTYAEGYRSLESYSYNWQTDTFYLHPTEINWWYVNEDTIKYYMDPRNFLDEKSIFAFEVLSYQSSYQTLPLVKTLLDKSFMPSIYANFYEDELKQQNYAQDFIEAAVTYNISPVHLASRIILEGNSSSTVTYDGVTYPAFNFFNINATGYNPAYQGLVWASAASGGTSYGRPWNEPVKSIMGGAQFLAEDYIGIGQDTLYFQKFAVSVESGRYTHQYQQNITAPLNEGYKIYNSYVTNQVLDENIIFVIPVYENMPSEKASIPKQGNPNYYLKNISINDEEISGFVYNKTSYEVDVDASVSEITLKATPINAKASIAGIGSNLKLEDGENNFTLMVTAENGNKLEYNLKVIKQVKQTDLSDVNNLKSLTIDEIDFDFDKDTLEYNLEVDYNVDKINITYELEDESSSVDTLNCVDLIVGKNTINIKVTAENNTLKTYTLNIVRKSPLLNDVLNNIGIKYNDKYITGISKKSSIDSLINNVNKIDNNASVTITLDNGEEKKSTILATGDKITFKNTSGEVTLQVLIYGDINGDGLIDKVDAAGVLRQYYNYANYNGIYKMAADVNKDGKIDKVDVATILRDYYGYANIEQ